jgi:septum site-determining protein MinD
VLTLEGVQRVIEDLKADFDYIVCDSPAGIEKGALMAMHFADIAFIVTNPEVSSVRDSDRILGMLGSKTKRAIEGGEPIKEHLIVTRYADKRVSSGEMLSIDDITDLLGVKLLGIVPECGAVLTSSNAGTPVIRDSNSQAGKAYQRIVARFLGETVPSYEEQKQRGFFKRFFSKDKEVSA